MSRMLATTRDKRVQAALKGPEGPYEAVKVIETWLKRSGTADEPLSADDLSRMPQHTIIEVDGVAYIRRWRDDLLSLEWFAFQTQTAYLSNHALLMGDPTIRLVRWADIDLEAA